MYEWMHGSSEQKKKDLNIADMPNLNTKFLELKQKYPDWLPILITSKDVKLTKNIFLSKEKIIFKKFAEMVRNFCSIETNGTTQLIENNIPLFFITNETLIPADDEIGKVYHIHKKNDGFLHIKILHEPDFVRSITTNQN
jgi:hypothetical protein